MPLDIAAVRPDYLVAVGYKWLLGPFSLGYLYVDPSRLDGQPLEQNWIARSGSEDFARLVDYRDDVTPGAQRFDVGERSNFALVPMATAAIRQLRAWGVEAIADAVRKHTDAIAVGAAELGYTSAPPSLRGPHMIGLRRAGGVPADLAARLADQRVYVSLRGDSIRVSPHLHTTPKDIARLLTALS